MHGSLKKQFQQNGQFIYFYKITLGIDFLNWVLIKILYYHNEYVATFFGWVGANKINLIWSVETKNGYCKRLMY